MKKLFVIIAIAVSGFVNGQVIQASSNDLRIADSIRKSNIDWNAVYTEFYILLNEYRKENNLSELVSDSTVFQVAKFQSDWMLKNNKLTHDNNIPGYRTIEDRCEKFGVNIYGGGECGTSGLILFAVAQHKSIAQYILDGWKRSQGHNYILLLPKPTKIGLSVSREKDSGNYYACLVIAR